MSLMLATGVVFSFRIFLKFCCLFKFLTKFQSEFDPIHSEKSKFETPSMLERVQVAMVVAWFYIIPGNQPFLYQFRPIPSFAYNLLE